MKTTIKFFVLALLALLAQVVSAQTVGIKVISTGNVGIGTANPVEKLDVDGGIRVGNTTSANAGTIRWNGNCFEGYDGTAWLALSAGCGGNGGPTCSDGIQNQGETGVDCGGPCSPCSSSGCESFPDILAERDLTNVGWNNEYNVGGTGISGDGELYFKVSNAVGNTQQYIGLSDNPSGDASFSGINFRILFYIRESNNIFWYRVFSEGSNSPWIKENMSSVGSTFSIERSGTSVNYKKDGSTFFTATTTTSTNVYFDNSFYDLPSSSLWGLRPSSFGVTNIDLCPPGSTPLTGGSTESSNAAVTPPPAQPLTNGLATELEQFEQYGISLANLEESFLSQPSPNPFSDVATVAFTIESDFFEAQLVFTDGYGRELGREDISSNKGIIEIESRDLKSGVYQYSLVVDGKIIKTNKMVVVK